MIHLRELRRASLLKWIPAVTPENQIKSAKTSSSASRFPPLLRYETRCVVKLCFSKWVSQMPSGNRIGLWRVPSSIRYRAIHPVKCSTFKLSCRNFCSETPFMSASPQSVVEAQSALLDYLQYTRGFQFPDAEHMSKNSPVFLHKLLKKVESEQETGRSITRYLRYHPINEFEPFFESLGLKPSELDPFLPRNLVFLCDDVPLLENYHVLCNYGIARGKMGKMYKEAVDIFRYSSGVLISKLRAYEDIGLSKTSIIKLVSASPSLLVGDVNRSFVKLLEELEVLGIDREWIGSNISQKKSYNWDRMISLLQFFIDTGLAKDEIVTLIRRNPAFLLEDSGNVVFLFVGLLSKMGGTKTEISMLLLQFPCVRVQNFVKNLHKCLLFLIGIEMEPEDICRIMRSHSHSLGSCSLKTYRSTLTLLNVGTKRLCRIVKEDPNQLLNYALRKRTSRLPKPDKDQTWFMHKIKFLLNLGLVENESSNEVEKIASVFRGKGVELQERYDYLVKKGLDPDDVSRMVKVAPQVLNMKLEVIESKIDLLVNGLGYPLESLVGYPSYLAHSIERVKNRFLMYDWLKKKGVIQTLSLSTIIACSDKSFTIRFVNRHPNGPKVWEKFKGAIHFT